MRKRTKVIAVVAATVILAGTATGAFAYWLASGSGTGQVQTSTAPVGLTVNQTSALNVMGPGDSPQTLSGDFDNTGSPSYVDTVTVSIASVTTVGAATCDASDYTLTGATMTVDDEIPVGAGVGSWSGATIQFNDKVSQDQSGCEGATVNLAYSIN